MLPVTPVPIHRAYPVCKDRVTPAPSVAIAWETATRAQIALLIYLMTNGVLFGAGVVLVLTWPTLSVDAGFWISAVVAMSFILAAPIAWWIAPRMRARYWRRRMAAAHASHE